MINLRNKKQARPTNLNFQLRQKRYQVTHRRLLYARLKILLRPRNISHFGPTFGDMAEEDHLIHPHIIIKTVIIEPEGLVIDHLGVTIFATKAIHVVNFPKTGKQEWTGLMECAGFIIRKANQPPVAWTHIDVVVTNRSTRRAKNHKKMCCNLLITCDNANSLILI